MVCALFLVVFVAADELCTLGWYVYMPWGILIRYRADFGVDMIEGVFYCNSCHIIPHTPRV